MHCGIRILLFLLTWILLIPVGDTRLNRRKISGYKRSQESLLVLKYETLVEKNWGPSLIHLSEDEFQFLLIQTPRNYTAFVLFNRRDTSDCELCRKARYNLNEIRYIYQDQGEPQFFFVEVYAEHRLDIHRRVGISQDSLPVLLYFPAYGRLENLEEMEHRGWTTYDLKNLVQWIRKMSGVHVNATEQYHIVDYVPNLTILVISLIYVYKSRETIFPFWCSQENLTIMLLGVIIFLVSGHMFNSINGVPFMASNPAGDSVFLYPGTGSQLGIETLIVFLIYSLTTYGLIMMTDFGAKARGDRKYANQSIHVFYIGVSLFSLGFMASYMLYAKKLRGN